MAALHVAIGRQNLTLFFALITHPNVDLTFKDRDGRKSIDMCRYTFDSEVFDAILRATYFRTITELDTIERHLKVLRP